MEYDVTRLKGWELEAEREAERLALQAELEERETCPGCDREQDDTFPCDDCGCVDCGELGGVSDPFTREVVCPACLATRPERLAIFTLHYFDHLKEGDLQTVGSFFGVSCLGTGQADSGRLAEALALRDSYLATTRIAIELTHSHWTDWEPQAPQASPSRGPGIVKAQPQTERISNVG